MNSHWLKRLTSQVRQTMSGWTSSLLTSVGFYDYVSRFAQDGEYIRADHSALTTGGPIAAIVTAFPLGKR
jgi:hypothetical protein